MNAIEFIENVNDLKEVNDDLSKLPAKKYFDTLVGKQILGIIASEVKIINKTNMELVDFDLTTILRKHPFYKKRNFFSDMEELGFTCKITSCHRDEYPIKTYLFELK